ncbi:hypothetical protein BHU72_14660 [Desulfuribacillus stibiiarsenatis]|uniref:DUF3800 domain-containing protein n=1 Tax=Desulfuribacillus stibiiarsenatis TaxID=1390249 RepID=A0A1E5L7N9_9FIRM|nr:DUF3800 domain-containing protein [Desulfuribacillus stibiiarsenatis]OEH86068.1 hypothetical protein BHU72_14660 [Desulfuribacillus stibiiarsenatis]
MNNCSNSKVQYYQIYFDESNKIESNPNTIYSFYGALGIDQHSATKLESEVQSFLGKNELHFVDFTSDTLIDRYYNVLSTALKKNIKINVIMLVNISVLKSSKYLNLKLNDIRNLFYIKIPERLIYGITRDIETNNANAQPTNIYIDKSAEYTALLLNSKIKDQLNAQSAYRNLKYIINEVTDHDSKDNIFLQIIDNLLGITSFVIEQKYSNNSIASKVKSELIYRLIHTGLKDMQDKIRIFVWNMDSQLVEVSYSKYLNDFLLHKNNYDNKEMFKLKTIIDNNPNALESFYLKEMGYANSRLKTLRGYINELEGRARTFSKDKRS